MNIQEAKQEIAHTLRAYLRKDADGSYLFPTVRQRPILLIGPPGIGKTAIMEQLAQECGVGLVAYTMTHHTRQSAIGLPRIAEKVYDGKAVSVTEYTLSEIVASIHEEMNRTGRREGILFLDEINCVSETLAPTMLQLLQNKTFGNHKIPDGWILVAAGNPPGYNKSVREFDVVTLDRVRQIQVEADLEVWLDYARARGVHGAIVSYLTMKSDRFYLVERQEDQLSFVTARGWEDLSELLKSYEALEIPVCASLAAQYLCKDAIARDFSAYYQLYRKYGADYGVTQLLQGALSPEDYAKKTAMASSGSFEERFTVVNLVLEQLQTGFSQYAREDAAVTQLHGALRQFLGQAQPFQAFVAARRDSFEAKLKLGLLPAASVRTERWVQERLEAMELSARQQRLSCGAALLEYLRRALQEDVQRRAALVSRLQAQLDRAFQWISDCFGDGQEMVLLVSSLTRSPAAMDFIQRHGCAPYLRCSQALLYRQQESQLQQACQELLQPNE